MDQPWKNFLEEEDKKEYFIKLKSFISERRKSSNVLPEPQNLFIPFELCRYNVLKVVIIGGEPYSQREHAHGLAFSSKSDKYPSALKYITEEVYNDYFHGNIGKVNPFKHNDLSKWADQGVLLINSTWTVEENKPGSHVKKGWEEFTGSLITFLNLHHTKLVFMLWGKQAKEYGHLVDQSKHLILESEHPSSAKHNENNWYGNKHFTKANDFIKKHYYGQKMEILWGIW